MECKEALGGYKENIKIFQGVNFSSDFCDILRIGLNHRKA
jgi:hypothetical protein